MSDDEIGDCLACATNRGEVPVPGGVIWETAHWIADHCVGSFGVGAVVVKTKAHRESLWQLDDAEAVELGPLLRDIAAAIVDALDAERVYLTMWVDKPPHHAHLVLWPRYSSDRVKTLALQLERSEEGVPASAEAEHAARQVRARLFQRAGIPE